MLNGHSRDVRILSVYPSARGCGFAVLEGHERLVNWGLATLPTVAPTELVIRVDAMIREWKPTVLVLEGLVRTRRSEITRQRIEALARHAASIALRVVCVESSAMALFFRQQANKFEIAQAVCQRFPELSQHMLPRRRPWESERERMAVFCAVALAVVAVA